MTNTAELNSTTEVRQPLLSRSSIENIFDWSRFYPFSAQVSPFLSDFTQALTKHRKLSPVLLSCRGTMWAGWGGTLIAQMALWDALVLPVVLGNPSGTLTTHTVHGLEAKSLQGVRPGKSFISEDTCATAMVRCAWNVLYRAHLKVISLFLYSN